jgi:tetratricopeptide (TPR) repeat protein
MSASDSLLLANLTDSLSVNYSTNNDSLIFQSDRIINLFPQQQADVNIKIAYLHYSQANYLLTEHYFTNAANIYLKDSLMEKYAEQLTNMGVIKEVSGLYSQATSLYFKALRVFDSLHIELKSAMIYNNLGIIYQQLKENEKALSYYKKSLEITEKLGRDEISAKRYNNIASVYEELEFSVDSSLYYYQKAYDIWKRDSVNRFLPIVENNLGNIYLAKKDFVKA